MILTQPIFTDYHKDLKMEWITLTNTTQVDELIQLPDSQVVVIFKHSTSCGISRMVYKNFKIDIESLDGDHTKFYYLDLKAHRDVSNYIAEKLNVRHESPQMIVLKGGTVVHHDSHHRISISSIPQ